MKVAVVGVGRIGALHAAIMRRHPAVDSVILVDADAKRARIVAEELDATAVPNLEAALAVAPEAIIIATPTLSHPELVRYCIQSKAAIFCEKPLAIDIAESGALVREIEQSQATVQLGFQRRFDSEYIAARNAIRSEEIGRLFSIRMISCDAEPPSLEFLRMSGGIFRDLHIHDYDVLRWITQQEVVCAYAAGSDLNSAVFGELNDYGYTASILQLEDGTLATMIGGRASPRGYDVRMELSGSLREFSIGTGYLPIDHRQTALSAPPRYSSFLDRFGPAYEAEIDAFIRLVSGIIPNPCPAVESLKALLVAEAASRSTALRRPVALDEVRLGRWEGSDSAG